MTQRPVVLVEDDPDDETLILRELRRNGVADPIEVLRDGAEALDRLTGDGAAARPLPVLVLLDLKLPRVSGLDVLRRMREDARARVVPVVVLTSSTEETDRLAAYSAGACSFVSKPVAFEAFARVVRELGVYWLLVNQPPPEAG